MIKKAKKRTLFLVGLLFTGIVSIVSNNVRSNYSKDESFFIPEAHADIAPWVAGGTWSADHSGGCCGDATNY